MVLYNILSTFYTSTQLLFATIDDVHAMPRPDKLEHLWNDYFGKTLVEFPVAEVDEDSYAPSIDDLAYSYEVPTYTQTLTTKECKYLD